jgi:quercetin dioxygenase-like cupin family protein
MHVAPVDLRTVRQDGIVVRFAMLGSMAYALAEIPGGGTSGTSLERPCTDPHWGFVVKGDLTFVTDGRLETIPAGRAFHVPAGGSSHRFEAAGAAVVAGFAPISSEAEISDDRLRAQGYELVEVRPAATIVPAIAVRKIAAGQVRAESWPMSQFQLMRVRMGERSGYTSGWCDAPHWGIVTSGRLAIEWEDDVEILTTGDVFHCPSGPPGHRIEAADPATFIDLTPVAALASGGRLAEWRRDPDRASPQRSRGISVAALG